jgi:hypothetical protein
MLLVIFVSCKNSDQFVYKDKPKLQPKSDRVYSVASLIDDLRVDVLWVVDNSGSMTSIQNNIIKNSSLFMNEFIESNIMEWKMGVMSTDMSDLPYLGFDPVRPFDFKSADPVTTFSDSIRRLGTDGDYNEYVFANLNRAMKDYSHFFRPNAHLAVIMVTDEEEQSSGPQYDPMAFINAIKGKLAPGKILRFYGAFNFGDLEGCQAFADYGGSPFESVIIETAGIGMSACTPDFGKKLAEIGKDIVSLGDSPKILLSELPILSTIKVMFENVELKGGPKELGGLWYYVEELGTIFFYNIDFIPEGIPNPKITVSFDIDDGYNRDEIE